MAGVLRQWYRRAPTKPQGTVTRVRSSTWSNVPPTRFQRRVRIQTAKHTPMRMHTAYMRMVTGPIWNFENPGEGI